MTRFVLMLATAPFRALRHHLRIYLAVRRFEKLQRDPLVAVTDVWLCARAVHWACLFAGAPRHWRGQSDRASRVASEIKQRTGNRILLWVLFPELD
jgi:hypothetical protein